MNQLTKNTNGECCPTFHVDKWDNRTFYWDDKNFIKEAIPTLFHIPFPPMIGKKITKMMKSAEGARKIAQDKEDVLLLFADPHPFKSELYLSVTGEVPDCENVSLTGTFKSRVFDGGYNDIPKFIKKMDTELSKQDQKAANYYVHYAYCPKCAKREGHNYMVLFAELEEHTT